MNVISRDPSHPKFNLNENIDAYAMQQWMNRDDINLKSLESSSLDGAIYINKQLAEVLFHLKGGKIGDFNAVKPVVFHNNAEKGSTLIAKGLIIYHPEVANSMDKKSLKMFMGESAAKEFFQLGNDNRPIEKFEFTGLDFTKSIENVGLTHTFNISAKDLGLGYRGDKSKGVVLSHSLNDHASISQTMAMRAWQDLEGILRQSKHYHGSLLGKDNNQLLDVLYDWKKSEGFEFSEGIYALSQKLVKWGMTTSDPMIKDNISRLFRTKMLDILRKPTISTGGENLIMPEVGYTLRQPIVREFVARLRETNGNVTDKVIYSIWWSSIRQQLL